MLEHIPSLVAVTFVYAIAIAALALLAVLLIVSAILDRTGEKSDRKDTDDVIRRVERPSVRPGGETPAHRAA